MNILQRYIVKTMVLYTLAIMFVWLSVYGFLNFINEVKYIGQANYTAFSALIYVSIDLLSVLYSHSSVIILLGTLLALGYLASTSQLVVIRAGGVSIMNIANTAIRAALSMLALVILIGEFITPTTIEYAKYYRDSALGYNTTAQTQQGFWLKDGDAIIKTEKNLGDYFENVTLIKLNNSTQLGAILYADKAIFDSENLTLKKAKGHSLDYSQKYTKITPQSYKQHSIKVSFNKKTLNDFKKKPSELSIWNLYKQIVFLSNNKLIADALKVEFYKRLIKPLTLIAMILLSMLFIFGSLRDSSLGKKIFLGLMLSLFFELSSRIGGVLSLKFAYNPFLSASVPTLIILALAFILLKRRSLR